MRSSTSATRRPGRRRRGMGRLRPAALAALAGSLRIEVAPVPAKCRIAGPLHRRGRHAIRFYTAGRWLFGCAAPEGIQPRVVDVLITHPCTAITHIPMHAVITCKITVVHVAGHDTPIDPYILEIVIHINIIDVNIGARPRNPAMPIRPSVIVNAMMFPVEVIVQPDADSGSPLRR